jgi:hypothetical protein
MMEKDGSLPSPLQEKLTATSIPGFELGSAVFSQCLFGTNHSYHTIEVPPPPMSDSELGKL